MILVGVRFRNRWQLIRQARHMFGQEQGFHVEEYKETEIGDSRRLHPFIRRLRGAINALRQMLTPQH